MISTVSVSQFFACLEDHISRTSRKHNIDSFLDYDPAFKVELQEDRKGNRTSCTETSEECRALLKN